jgi:hypothetical protein
MQTLGLAESTPRSESRIKALLWPSIQTGTDVDYLRTQGLWICTFVAVMSLLFGFLSGHPVIAILVFVLYIAGGMGVRQGSVVASLMTLLCYVGDSFATGIGIMRIIFAAILLSNLRASWLASQWQPDSSDAEMPPRLSETLGDKFADKLPLWLWPKIRFPYYVYSFGMLVVITAGVIIILMRRMNLLHR